MKILIYIYVSIWSSITTNKNNGLASGLICSRCKQKSDSPTIVPTTAPNSRFIFGSVNDTCDEEDVICLDQEQFCIAAAAKTVDDTFWIQKGCIGSNDRNGVGAGFECTDDHLNSSEVLHSSKSRQEIQQLKMTVCVCNTNDNCNHGSIFDMSTKNSCALLFSAYVYYCISLLFIVVTVNRTFTLRCH